MKCAFFYAALHGWVKGFRTKCKKSMAKAKCIDRNGWKEKANTRDGEVGKKETIYYRPGGCGLFFFMILLNLKESASSWRKVEIFFKKDFFFQVEFNLMAAFEWFMVQGAWSGVISWKEMIRLLFKFSRWSLKILSSLKNLNKFVIFFKLNETTVRGRVLHWAGYWL